MATKIAIIEDEQAITMMYKFKFEAEGFAVVTAENGKTGLEMVEKELPDLILLDLMMPEMTGDEMLAEMRKTEWGKDIKVIILTNVSETEMGETVRPLAAERYIIKAIYTPQQVV